MWLFECFQSQVEVELRISSDHHTLTPSPRSPPILSFSSRVLSSRLPRLLSPTPHPHPFSLSKRHPFPPAFPLAKSKSLHFYFASSPLTLRDSRVFERGTRGAGLACLDGFDDRRCSLAVLHALPSFASERAKGTTEFRGHASPFEPLPSTFSNHFYLLSVLRVPSVPIPRSSTRFSAHG